MLVAIRNTSLQFDSVIGDLCHKQDVYLHFGRVDQLVVQRFITNKAQADWLREHLPGLVPPPDNSGNKPSDHSVATVFEVKYNEPSFRSSYLSWLRHQNV